MYGNNTFAMNQNLLKPKELAEQLQMSVGTVRKLAKRGEIPSHKIGNAYRFLLSEIVEQTKTLKPTPQNSIQ